jgi:hypothetical protein
MSMIQESNANEYNTIQSIIRIAGEARERKSDPSRWTVAESELHLCLQERFFRWKHLGRDQ